MNTDITIANETPSVPAFADSHTFELAQRMARALCASDLVPQQFRGEKGLANTLIALELAQRTGASPLAVMQNLYVVQGKPTWSAQFIIAALNACGRFTPLRFVLEGTGDNATCYAWAEDRASGERLEGPTVSMQMAQAEGWSGKPGSKWKTMPALMLRYRAATFFGRLYAPDLLLGMQTVEEARDIEVDADGNVTAVTTRGVSGLKARLAQGGTKE
ncbi:MAG: recombinase RecT [Chromatiaceae bacterium]|jgi:hypothetical protein|nr:recombinase RecT [Chromatiaceae bacterium]